MKAIKIILFSCLGILLYGCHKADDYYYDYKKEAPKYDGTIYEYLINQPGVYDSLVSVIERLPDVRARLASTSDTSTFFAVNNRSFEVAIANMNEARVNNKLKPLSIESLDIDILDSIANRYLFDSYLNIDVLVPYQDGITLPSNKYNYDMNLEYRVLTASGVVGSGEQQILLSDVNSSIYIRYWQSIQTKSVDLKASNGVIHTLSSQHDYGFGKLVTFFSK